MKPVLFNTPMVQALLNTKPGTWPAEPIDPSRPFKSQTRRAVEDPPCRLEASSRYRYDGICNEPDSDDDGCHYMEELTSDGEPTERYLNIGKAPYQVGDRLWVRETFQAWGYWFEYWDVAKNKTRKKFIDLTDGTHPYLYDGGFVKPPAKAMTCDVMGYWKRPSIYMPRKVARLFLEVKAVRVEQLRRISLEDCVSEGAVKKPHYIKWGGEKCLSIHGRYKKDFSELWNSINGKGAWESNPWVWVYEYMRVEG